jgi:transcriptional accessory protein Tex/SPT6
MKKHPELKLSKVVVSEAGASVYSASETAGQRIPRTRREPARRGCPSRDRCRIQLAEL